MSKLLRQYTRAGNGVHDIDGQGRVSSTSCRYASDGSSAVIRIVSCLEGVGRACARISVCASTMATSPPGSLHEGRHDHGQGGAGSRRRAERRANATTSMARSARASRSAPGHRVPFSLCNTAPPTRRFAEPARCRPAIWMKRKPGGSTGSRRFDKPAEVAGFRAAIAADHESAHLFSDRRHGCSTDQQSARETCAAA